MGLVGERKAIVSAVLALYALLFLVIALTAPDAGLVPYMSAMAAMYGLGFFSLVAGYFWARWFAMGLGIYGLGVGALLIWQIGLEPIALFYTITHGMISGLLWDHRMAAHFDGRTDWRERYHLDESGTHRLGRAVIRVGISLPVLLAYGLAPRNGMGETLLVAGAVGLAGLGIWGLLRLRTWGLLAMLGGSAAILISAVATSPLVGTSAFEMNLLGAGIVSSTLLLAATAPFAIPMISYLRRS